MSEIYKETIAKLVQSLPFEGIDTNIKISGRVPSTASSEFLTNKEQGDWAERVVLAAINQNSPDFTAVKYGRADSLAAGDPNFADFYRKYQDELNEIGKKPDILIFKKSDILNPDQIDLNLLDVVSTAVAAIEVRSSSFLASKYAAFMQNRTSEAEKECERLCNIILTEPFISTLQQKSPDILNLIQTATSNTFRELDFRLRSWSSSEILRQLSDYLKQLKEQIKILHKRDFLSITPKLEDIALVNRWIQYANVPHYYLQVFFDKAYVISFREILEIASESSNEDTIFSVERDIKNQGKTTIKVNVQVGKEIINNRPVGK